MLVTNRQRSRLSLPALVAAAVAGGVDAVQLREPDLDPASLLALAMELRDLIAGQAALLINSNLAVAAWVGAGVHLSEVRAVAASARAHLGPVALLGRSVHSPAAAAAATGVDYVIAGHVYATVSKPGQPPLGLAGLREIVAVSPAPVLAIGGITAERVAATLAAGAAGIAVIGAIAEAADPRRAAAGLRSAIDHALEQPMEQPRPRDPATGITVTINGKPVTLLEDATITGFITDKGFTAEMVIVELNGEIVPRPAYPATPLRSGDRLEIVHAVGGG